MIKNRMKRKGTAKNIKPPVQRRISTKKIKLDPISPLHSSKENINLQLHSNILTSANTLPKIPLLSNIHLIKTKQLSPLQLHDSHILRRDIVQGLTLQKKQNQNILTQPQAITPTGNRLPTLNIHKRKQSTDNSQQKTNRQWYQMNQFERPRVIEIFKKIHPKEEFTGNRNFWQSVERDISSIKKQDDQIQSHSSISVSMF